MTPEDLLATARYLIQGTAAEAQLAESLVRKATSTAYYAAFHGIVQANLDYNLTWSKAYPVERERAARKFTHRIIRDVCARLRQQKPLRLSAFYFDFLYLYDERQKADYDLLATFDITQPALCTEAAASILYTLSDQTVEDAIQLFHRELFVAHFGQKGG